MKPVFAIIGIIVCSLLLFFMGFSFAFTGMAESECPLIDGCAALQLHMFIELALTLVGTAALVMIYASRKGKCKYCECSEAYCCSACQKFYKEGEYANQKRAKG